MGGTFDPIHYGHLSSAETIREKLNLDEVWFVPTSQNPLKKEEQTSEPKVRGEMVRRALSTLDGDVFKLNEIELSNPGVSYTIQTLKSFLNANKNHEFYLIIGADNLLTFNKWKDYKNILKLANLVVTSRPGSDLPKNKTELPPYLAELTSKFNTSDKAKLKTGRQIFFEQLEDIDISATILRRKIRRGENVSQYMPGVIEEYLKECKAYDKDELLVKDYKEFTKFCSQFLIEKGALGLNAYDIKEMTQPAEYTIAASGTSMRHTRALSELLAREVKLKFGLLPMSIEGETEGRWVVLDYGALMIHLFYDYVRNEYRIEELWSRAPRLSI